MYAYIHKYSIHVYRPRRMAFEAGRGGSGLEPKLAGLRLTPADFAGPRRRTPQDLGRILAGPGAGPSGPPVLGGPILECRELGSGFGALHLGNGCTRTSPPKVRIRHLDGVKARSLKPVLGSFACAILAMWAGGGPFGTPWTAGGRRTCH